jgi:hypothetical protein
MDFPIRTKVEAASELQINPQSSFTVVAFRLPRRSVALINRFLETVGNQLKMKGTPSTHSSQNRA